MYRVRAIPHRVRNILNCVYLLKMYHKHYDTSATCKVKK